MNKIVMSIGLCLAIGLLSGGCASPGGALVVGPFSYASSRHIDKAKMSRSAVMSTQLSTEKKQAVIRAVNMSMGPNEIAAGFQVNVTELFSSNYTGGELFMQGAAALLDLAAEAAAGYALTQTFTKDSHDTRGVTITGNGNAVNYNDGTGNSNSGTTIPGSNNNTPGGDYNEGSNNPTTTSEP